MNCLGMVSRYREDGRYRLGTIQVYPHMGVRDLDAPAYHTTLVRRLRNEAWHCFNAGRLRASVVVARSALQCLCLLYVEPGRGLKDELSRLAVKAGTQWAALAAPLKDFGDDLVHPNPLDLSSIVPAAVEARLRDLDAVIMFTAALERKCLLSRRSEGDIRNDKRPIGSISPW
jgi:hypothetical protein